MENLQPITTDPTCLVSTNWKISQNKFLQLKTIAVGMYDLIMLASVKREMNGQTIIRINAGVRVFVEEW